MSYKSVLVDSRNRVSGTAWQYAVTLAEPMPAASGVQLRWIEFVDTGTQAPADIFRNTPFVSLHVSPFQGHTFSTNPGSRGAIAILKSDLNVNAYRTPQEDTGGSFFDLSTLTISFRDCDGNILQNSGVEHVFLLEITLEMVR